MTEIKLQGEFNELEFLEAFWVEPTQRKPEDGYWCYEITDELGIALKFGIDIIQASVQIELKLAENSIGIFSFENVESINILDYQIGKLYFESFLEGANVTTQVHIELRSRIKIKCSTLSLAAA